MHTFHTHISLSLSRHDFNVTVNQDNLCLLPTVGCGEANGFGGVALACYAGLHGPQQELLHHRRPRGREGDAEHVRPTPPYLIYTAIQHDALLSINTSNLCLALIARTCSSSRHPLTAYTYPCLTLAQTWLNPGRNLAKP